MANRKGVSVVICSYNGSSRIAPTLHHIARQEVQPNLAWEVILIDNNSKDDTGRKALALWESEGKNIPFRVVWEAEPGLSFAKMRGLQEAQFSYLIYVDDDNSISSNYVQTVHQIFEEWEDVAVCGGDGEDALPAHFVPPHWWNTFKADYAVGKQGTKEGYKINGFIWGAASGFRVSALRELYFEVGHQPFLTGRIGNKLTAGEDAEVCFCLQRLGYRLYYSPKLQFKHHIPIDRINEAYLMKLKKGFGAASVILSIYSDLVQGKQPNWEKSYRSCRKTVFQKTWKYLVVYFSPQKRLTVKANLIYAQSRLKTLRQFKKNYEPMYYQLKESLNPKYVG
ncbi:MAG: glycosyltransferase family 2 protein [Saprospiraceae bacterium]|nr:glycosyltransferase family 2 protein [Saprospiraceae bacterium]